MENATCVRVGTGVLVVKLASESGPAWILALAPLLPLVLLPKVVLVQRTHVTFGTGATCSSTKQEDAEQRKQCKRPRGGVVLPAYSVYTHTHTGEISGTGSDSLSVNRV